ncbi:MAG: DUF3048 domain-containing protein [Nocardioides sp.]
MRPTPLRFTHITSRWVAVIMAGALIAGCGANDERPEPDSAGAGPAKVKPKPKPVTEPLTGVEVAKGRTVNRRHSVMVVKIDNTAASSPQTGLGQADLVVEEMVEGGLTRLAAFFYAKTPRVVGPVRSMRASDIGIVSPVKASVVTSGAAQVTIDRIQGAKIRFYSEGVTGISRDYSRSAPYNVFADLRTIGKQAKNKNGRPTDYLPWGKGSDFAGPRQARAFDVRFSPTHTTEWAFRRGKYVNLNSNAAPGDQFPADSVLVLEVAIGDAGYTDPAGYPVPETKLAGRGPAALFHKGRLVRGTWIKDGLTGTIELTTPDGPLTVPAGHVWIELIPKADGSITLR